MSISSPSLGQLKRAVELSQQIEKLEAEFRAVLGGGSEVGNGRSVEATSTAVKSPKRGRKGKRVFSAETRAKMAAAQQARHAKKNAAKPAKKAGGKRVLSPEALQAIRDGQKKRWAKVKKGK